MNRREYMEKLEQLLTNIPHSEKQEVLQYYEDYFADAGEEQEEEVIAGLGTPEQLAERIKADLKGEQPEGEFTERGYREPEYERQEFPAKGNGFQEQGSSFQEQGGNFQEQGSSSQKQGSGFQAQGSANPYGEGSGSSGEKKKWDRNQIVLVIILCILASPLIVGIGGGLFGLVFGGLAGLFGILVGFSATAFALVAAGIGMIVAGLTQIILTPAIGFGLLGAGLLLLALGIVSFVGIAWLWAKVLPKLFKGIVNLIRRIFRGKEKTA